MRDFKPNSLQDEIFFRYCYIRGLAMCHWHQTCKCSWWWGRSRGFEGKNSGFHSERWSEVLLPTDVVVCIFFSLSFFLTKGEEKKWGFQIQYNPEITVLEGPANFDLYRWELLLVGDHYVMIFSQFLQIINCIYDTLKDQGNVPIQSISSKFQKI